MYKFQVLPGNYSNLVKEAIEKRKNWQEVRQIFYVYQFEEY
jgi:hypothetical protein